MYKKTTTTVEEYFGEGGMPVPPVAIPGAARPKLVRPIIRIDVPLMIKLLEYAREESKSDSDLHEIVERMVELCEYGEVLEMEDYDEIVPVTPMPTPMPDQPK